MACASRPWLLRHRVPGTNGSRCAAATGACGRGKGERQQEPSPQELSVTIGVGELVPLFSGALNWSSPHGRFLLRLLVLRLLTY